MLKVKLAKNLQPGDRVYQPFNRHTVVKKVEVGRIYATVHWEEPYEPYRYELNYEVGILGDDE